VPDGLADRLERVKTLLITTNKFVKDYKGKDEIIDNLTKAILRQNTCLVEYNSSVMTRLRNSKSILSSFLNGITGFTFLFG
jgi:hypothetical protein